MKQMSLEFTDEVSVHEPNPMVKAFGKGPAESSCSACKHFVPTQDTATGFGCAFRQSTANMTAEHNTDWNTCGKFEERAGASV